MLWPDEEKMYSIHVPSGYHIYEKDSGSWVPVDRLLGRENLYCWNGMEFCKVKVSCTQPPHPVNKLALIDSITIIGLDDSVKFVESCTQWVPPWLTYEGKPGSVCQSKLSQCALLAIADFGREAHHYKKSGAQAYIVPKHRFEQMSNYLPNVEHIPLGNNWEIIYIPNKEVAAEMCEAGEKAVCRAHGIHYIETVLALKGRLQRKRKDHGLHVDLRDDGLHVSPHAFRRLRRIMTCCGVLNRYGFRVITSKNGKKRQEKRRVRLGIPNTANIKCLDAKVKEHCKDYIQTLNVFKTCPKNALRNAKYLDACDKVRTATKWIKITLETSVAIVVEGIMLLLA